MLRKVLFLLCLCSGTILVAEAKGPLKVFILAGDENCLEQAPIDVSDSVKYPEFAGNVKSVDMRSFVRPGKGQPSCYYENAATYLEIGEALGQGMRELLKKNKQ